MRWYLDRQTGEVIGLSDDYLFVDDEEDDEDEDEEPQDPESEQRKLRRAIDRDGDGRYLDIPSLGSHEGFRIMEGFADAQGGRVRDALFDALKRHRPFRSFKDALAYFPEVRQRWFTYHEERMREEALAWLRSEEIDAELTRPEIPED